MLLNSQRPGGETDGHACLMASYIYLLNTLIIIRLKKLKESGRLKRNWSPTSSSTDYSEMQEESSRFYSSNGYGLQRNTFVSL